MIKADNMMKKKSGYISLLLAGFLFTQCGNADSFTVTGLLTGGENDTLVVEEMVENGIQPLQSLYTDENGRFTYTDTATNPRFLFLHVNDIYISLLVLNNQQIDLSADLSRFNETYRVSGSRESELIWDLNREMQRAALALDSLGSAYEAKRDAESSQAADNWFRSAYQNLIEDQRDFIQSFLNEHYDSPASLMALSHQLNQQPILNPAADFAYFARVDSALTAQYPESRMVKTLHTWVVGQQQQQAARETENQSVGIGVLAPDFSLPDPDGQEISLSSLRGKYILLDFWAAWCAPCRRENPNLVRAWTKYKDKGFDILQVSLDRTREDWVGAIEADNLTWTHVSDLQYWSSPIAKLYYVQSIPASFLLDPEGRIIARNLRGPALEQKLKEVLK